VLTDIAIRRLSLKKMFLPSFKDLENQECKEIVERLRGRSVKETLTNILEWQERNIVYWKERYYVKISSVCKIVSPYYEMSIDFR